MPYAGWKNYQTWSVNLHIGNVEELYHEARTAETPGELKQMIVDAIDELCQRFANEIGIDDVDLTLIYMMHDLALYALEHEVDWESIFNGLQE